MPHQLARIPGHLERLARTLRVPHDPGPAIALDRLDRLRDCLGDGPILVVFGADLGGLLAVAGERDEVVHPVQEHSWP